MEYEALEDEGLLAEGKAESKEEVKYLWASQ